MNKREFRKLEKKWYDRLQKEKFDDIEDTNKIGRPLKQFHSFAFVSETSQKLQAKRVPYQSQIEEFRFKPAFNEICGSVAISTNLSKGKIGALWDMHVEGKTEREIAMAFECSKTKVHKILEKMRQWMTLV
jgi:hypothetical protein